MIRPIGGTADVGIFSDASAADGGLAAVALCGQSFVALLTGTDHEPMAKSPSATNGIYGFEILALKFFIKYLDHETLVEKFFGEISLGE